MAVPDSFRLGPSATVPDSDSVILRENYAEEYEAGREWRRAADAKPGTLSFWDAALIHFHTHSPESQVAKLAFQAGWERP